MRGEVLGKSSSSGDGSASSSGLEDVNTNDGAKGEKGGVKMCMYRLQLEQDAQQLLANIKELEMVVSKLEEELVALHFQLSQEKNERCLSASLSLPLSQSPPSYSPAYSRDLISGLYQADQEEATANFPLLQQNGTAVLNSDSLMKNCWNHPNKISEEMVRCMRDIFVHLSDSSTISYKCSSLESAPSRASPHWPLSFSSLASFSDSSIFPPFTPSPSDELRQSGDVMATENIFDPYRFHEKKAAYTVGGYSFSAADIEYIILKMKPPPHRPQMALVVALHKFKISEEQKKYSIDKPQPLVSFSLSCGRYSSPAVRIFTAANVNAELCDSLRDYIRASVGMSNKGKLLVPKLVHCVMKGIIDDSTLPDWICRFLPPKQAARVWESTSLRKHRLLVGARSFSVMPFDSRFRYLFLPESERSPTCSSWESNGSYNLFRRREESSIR